VDLGGRLLQAAAAARDNGAVKELRAELLPMAEKQAPALKTTITWTNALAAASVGKWADIPDEDSGWSPDRLRQMAILRARQGETGAAVDLIEEAPGPAGQHACWQIAAAWAGDPHLQLVDLFVWITELPDAECRCAAMLGAASAVHRSRPAGVNPAP
jgi:hypothetical protein